MGRTEVLTSVVKWMKRLLTWCLLIII